MILERRIETIEEKIGSNRKLSKEELLRRAWERFLHESRGEEVSDEKIEVDDGELDEYTLRWVEFLSGEVEIDIDAA